MQSLVEDRSFRHAVMPQLGIHLGVGIVAAIIDATIGALLLLLIIRLVRGAGTWGAGWRRNW
jgi:uncharacterized membrane protein YeaQ/YmgE (transglycosylase-associated protein family)